MPLKFLESIPFSVDFLYTLSLTRLSSDLTISNMAGVVLQETGTAYPSEAPGFNFLVRSIRAAYLVSFLCVFFVLFV